MRALKADVATLRQEMMKQKDRESALGERAHGGQPRQDHPRGCEKCVQDGKNCTHCWRCGASDNYTYRCTQNEGQGNYPLPLTADTGRSVVGEILCEIPDVKLPDVTRAERYNSEYAERRKRSFL